MQLPMEYLQNIVEQLPSNSYEAHEQLAELAADMLPEHWDILLRLVEENRPYLIAKPKDGLELDVNNIPF